MMILPPEPLPVSSIGRYSLGPDMIFGWRPENIKEIDDFKWNQRSKLRRKIEEDDDEEDDDQGLIELMKQKTVKKERIEDKRRRLELEK